MDLQEVNEYKARFSLQLLPDTYSGKRRSLYDIETNTWSLGVDMDSLKGLASWGCRVDTYSLKGQSKGSGDYKDSEGEQKGGSGRQKEQRKRKERS